MNLQHADVRRILELLDTAEYLDSLDLRIGDVVLQARKPGAASMSALPVEALAPTTASARPRPRPRGRDAAARAGRTSVTVSSPALAEVPDRMIAIRAPMPGTFYRTRHRLSRRSWKRVSRSRHPRHGVPGRGDEDVQLGHGAESRARVERSWSRTVKPVRARPDRDADQAHRRGGRT